MSEEIGSLNIDLLSDEERKRLARKKATRNARRRDRDDEGMPLNINSMMDMMTIILVFLLKSFSSEPIVITENDDLRVPFSSTELPPEDMLVITITKSAILVEDRPIGIRLTNGEVDVGQLQSVDSPILPILQTEVERVFERGGQFAAVGLRGSEQVATIVADADTPFRTLMQVMMTAQAGGVQNFKFAAIQRSQGSGLVAPRAAN